MVRCCGIVISTAFFISSFKGGQPPAGAKSTCWTDVLCALSIRRGRAAGHRAPRKKREGTLEMSSLFKLVDCLNQYSYILMSEDAAHRDAGQLNVQG